MRTPWATRSRPLRANWERRHLGGVVPPECYCSQMTIGTNVHKSQMSEICAGGNCEQHGEWGTVPIVARRAKFWRRFLPIRVKICYNAHRQFKTLRSPHRFGSGETWKFYCESLRVEDAPNGCVFFRGISQGFPGPHQKHGKRLRPLLSRDRGRARGKMNAKAR